MKVKHLILGIISIVFIGISIGLGYFLWPTGKVIDGVFFENQSMAHMSQQDVLQYVTERNDRASSIVLTGAQGENKTISLKDLGIQIDTIGTATEIINYGYESNWITYIQHRLQAYVYGVNIATKYRFESSVAESYFMELAKDMGPMGQNARLSLEGSQIIRHKAKIGRQLDIKETLTHLKEQVERGQLSSLQLVIQDAVKPQILDSDLEPINALLGTYTTYYNEGNYSRSHNIYLAGQKINETIIPPGGMFSFNDIVGERTAEAGYDDAPVFFGGRLVPGIGGGICQISSTLFNTALLSGMDIVERDTHFAPVSYIPVGLDATVAWGYIDFQFKNPYAHPIYIITEQGGGAVTISILGNVKDVPQSVSIITTNEKDIPHKTVEKVDPTKDKDSIEEEGHKGISIDTIRTIIYGNGESSTYTFHSYYEPVDRIIIKGKESIAKEEKKEKDTSHTKKEERSKKSKSKTTSSSH